MNKPVELKATISNNTDEYECWKCHQTATPVKGYNLYLPDLQEKYVAKFCSNRRCNLLWVNHNPAQQFDSIPLESRVKISWNNGDGFEQIEYVTKTAYVEACRSFVDNCYLATALLCRSMIVYAAKDKGYVPEPREDGSESSSFKAPIDYLENNHLISSVKKDTLNTIRRLGNRATHKSLNISKKDALTILVNLDAMLKDIYIKES